MSRVSKILRNEEIQVKGTVSLKMSEVGQHMNLTDRLFKEKEEIENSILKAKEEYENIINETLKAKQNIIDEANEEAKSIEKKAYELGYEQGMKNGYEDGFKESYEKNIEKAIAESEAIKEESYNTLLNIKTEAEEYIKENKERILKISIAIAEQVLREEFKHETSMNNMLKNIISQYSLKKDLIIKINSLYKEELEKSINEMINENSIEQKIFVIADNSLKEGNAEIQTENGKLVVGIDSVLDKVKAELL